MKSNLKHQLLLHLIIFIWGFTGILGKLIHLTPFQIVWYRVLIALVSLIIALKWLKKDLKIHSKTELLKIFLVGIVVALHWFTFYKSIELSTASLGILCLSTTTLHVTWLEPLIMGRRFSKLEFLFGLIVIYGIYFVSGDFSQKHYEALSYGLFSALCAAVFSVCNAKLIQKTSAHQITFYEMIAAFVFLSIAIFFTGSFDRNWFSMRWEDFAWLLFLGIICTSFAFLVTVEIVKYLGAFTVSLSINMEPVYTIILAIVILNENEILSSDFYLGAVLIVVVVVLNAVVQYFIKKKSVLNLPDQPV